ncbi:hypothetical protein [Agrobacterium vitis]|nr:hypothetical protein [Agrobacterium vitis]
MEITDKNVNATQHVADPMPNGLDWFIVVQTIKHGAAKEGRLKFLANGQPYYEGELSPDEFMEAFLSSAKKETPISATKQDMLAISDPDYRTMNHSSQSFTRPVDPFEPASFAPEHVADMMARGKCVDHRGDGKIMAPPSDDTTAPAQGPITYHNDDAGFTEFLNSDQPYSVREIDGHCAILMDRQQAHVIGYRAYDHERANPVTLTYTNYRGETSERTILPKNIWFGSTEWHPEPQWLLTAFDLGKQTVRDFALKDFGKPTSTELFGLCALPVPMPFTIGDLVEKYTGDYTAKGEVRGIFATTRGAVRYVVEHQADGGGSFCHIYSEKNLRPARRFAVLPTDCPAASPEMLESIAKAKAIYDAMSPEEKARHDQAQRESFLRGMMPTGDPRLD